MEGNIPLRDDNRGPLLLQYIWTGVGVASIFVAARAFTRVTVSGGLKWDDHFMGLALLTGIVVGVLTTKSVNLGFGRHLAFLSYHQASEAVRYQYIIEPLSFLALVFGRVSFAISLIKIIGVTKLRRWMLYILIIGQVVINLVMVGILLGACNPPEKYWNPAVKGSCINPRVIEYGGYAQSAWNIFTDFALAILPAVVISNLNLGVRTKIGLVVLMSLGIFNMVAAIITLVEITKLGGGSDITYKYVFIAIWGIVQTYLAIIVASIPFIYPLFRNSKLLTLSFYTSLLNRHHKKPNPSSPSPSPPLDLPVRPAPRLPTVKRDRFATTTLWKAGAGDADEDDEDRTGLAGNEEIGTHRAGIEYGA